MGGGAVPSGKRPRKVSGSESPRAKKPSKPPTSGRSRRAADHEIGSDAKSDENADEDSDEDLMDRLSKRSKTTNIKKPTTWTKSNGAKKQHLASPSSSSSAKKSKHHNKKNSAPKDLSGDEVGGIDEEDDVDVGSDNGGGVVSGGRQNFVAEEDQEECSAKNCKKPQGTAIDWIQCDKCAKWYHQVCLSLSAQEADVDVYYCPSCCKKR